MIARAFEEGVKAALKFFQSPGTREALARAADTVMKNMKRAASAARKVKK
jgi:hypothetical protein